MGKKQMNTKGKETANKRSKLKEQRLMRLKTRIKVSNIKKDNDELMNMVTSESIDQLSFKEKMTTLTKLHDLIIAYPDSNSDKIKLMLTFLKNSSVNVISKATELLKNIFYDVIPSYRINQAQSKQRESKDIEALHTQERTLAETYEEYIKSLSLLDKSLYKNKDCEPCRIVFTKCIKDLLEKFYYFNHEDLLINFLIDKLSDDLKEIRLMAFQGLYQVLSTLDNTATMLNLKIGMIKRISNVFYAKPHDRFDSNALELFAAHKIEFPDIANLQNDKKVDLSDLKFGASGHYMKNGTKQENRLAKREQKSFEKEKNKIAKSLKKELSEIEGNETSPRMIYYSNLKMLKKILLVYFDILKNKPDSKLIQGVFIGVATLCENINVEILLDLQKCIYKLISTLLKRNQLSIAILALKANLCIAVKLTKLIVSIQDTYLISSSYEILCALCNDKRVTNDGDMKDDLFIVFEVIEMILLKIRMFSIQIISSFAKRLAIFAEKQIGSHGNYALATLILLKRIMAKYSELSGLLDDDGETDMFNYTSVDPEYCNAKNTSIIPEIKNTIRNFPNIKIIKQAAEYILKAEKTKVELSCLNFYDVLLKKL